MDTATSQNILSPRSLSRRQFFNSSSAVCTSAALAWAWPRLALAWGDDVDCKDENSAEFIKFLNRCTIEERIQLGQSLQMFPALAKEDFGRFGLKAHHMFADKATDATRERPVRPSNFNELPPDYVAAAVREGRLDEELTTTYKILSNLLYRYNNFLRYPFTDRDQVNYHEVVQWVAQKKGIPDNLVKLESTFRLEQEIHKKFLEGIWDRLTVEQRLELLKEIEKQTGTTIADKAAMAALGGGAAIAALGVTVTMAGFAFYTTMSVVICTVAGWLGLTLPFWVYMGASSTVALLAGPVGLIVAALSILGSLAWFALPNVDRTAAFVMTMNVIKAQRLHKAGKLR